MTRICTICARGGSKGLPGKNVMPLFGRPLIAHTVAQAVESALFDEIAVSSDSAEILEAAAAAGSTLSIVRPAELASDLAGKLPAIVHCLEQAEERTGRRYDTLVDLDATSPLRAVSDIVGAVALLESTGVKSVITGAPARRSPYFNLIERDPDGVVALSKPLAKGVLRRQDSPPCFDMNASIYVWDRRALSDKPRVFYDDTRLFEMPEVRSQDIDSELDFEIVKMLMARANNQSRGQI